MLASEEIFKKKVGLGDVTLVLPRWEAAHVTGGGQLGAELRDDYYGGGTSHPDGCNVYCSSTGLPAIQMAATPALQDCTLVETSKTSIISNTLKRHLKRVELTN